MSPVAPEESDNDYWSDYAATALARVVGQSGPGYLAPHTHDALVGQFRTDASQCG